MKRPSILEIQHKIGHAKEAVAGGDLSILKPSVLAAEALEMGIHFEEINRVLMDLLCEIRPRDYAGQYPPQRSYEEEISSSELFAFGWMSKRLGLMIYLKFSFKEHHLWLVSLHQDRADSKGRGYARIENELSPRP
jgi:hypothetical protein